MLKFSICSCIIFLTSVSIFLMVILNSLLGESYASISLEFVSRDLSYSFIWNLSAWFLIFLDFFCLCLCIKQSRHLPQSSWTGLIQKTSTDQSSQRFWASLPTLYLPQGAAGSYVFVFLLCAKPEVGGIVPINPNHHLSLFSTRRLYWIRSSRFQVQQEWFQFGSSPRKVGVYDI